MAIDGVSASDVQNAVSQALKTPLTVVAQGGEVNRIQSYDNLSKLFNWSYPYRFIALSMWIKILNLILDNKELVFKVVLWENIFWKESLLKKLKEIQEHCYTVW